MKKILFFCLLLFIILLSLFPRSIEVLNQNPIFGFDQGREYLAARNIVVNHKLILIGTELGAGSAGINGIFHGPIYYYLLTIPFLLFLGNPAGGVYLMLFFSLASVFFGYFLVSKIFNKKTGILTALLFAISPPLISQARFIWSPNMVTLFILISFYFTFLLTEKKSLSIFLAAFFSAFIYNFEFAIAIPLSLSLVIYSIFIFKNEIRSYLFLILGFITAFLPMIIFDLRHGLMGERGIVSYVFSKHPSSSNKFVNLLIDHFKSFIDNFTGTFPQGNFFGLILFVLIFLLTILFLIKEKQVRVRKFILYLLSLPVITFFVFVFLNNTVYQYYLIHLNLTYLVLFTYVFLRVSESKMIKIYYFTLFLIILLSFNAAQNAYLTSIKDYSDYGGTAKLNGKVDAIDFIYKDAKNKNFDLLVFSPPVYTYPYDYILYWYGKNKYNYIPGKDKKGTFYLLIEKDGSKPWSYEGWLKTVVKTGRIVDTVTLPSGFIVQKREAL